MSNAGRSRHWARLQRMNGLPFIVSIAVWPEVVRPFVAWLVASQSLARLRVLPLRGHATSDIYYQYGRNLLAYKSPTLGLCFRELLPR